MIETLPATRRHQVDKELITGVKSHAEIGRELGCSAATVSYYKAKVLAPLLRVAADTRDTLERKSARERLALLYADADSLLKTAMTQKDVRAGSQAVRELHSILRTELELDGSLNQPPPSSSSQVLNAELVQVLMLPKSPSVSSSLSSSPLLLPSARD